MRFNEHAGCLVGSIKSDFAPSKPTCEAHEFRDGPPHGVIEQCAGKWECGIRKIGREVPRCLASGNKSWTRLAQISLQDLMTSTTLAG